MTTVLCTGSEWTNDHTNVLNWPSKIPDLNVIENAWDLGNKENVSIINVKWVPEISWPQVWLDKQTPFIRHIEEEELWMYRYPSVPSIVPKWALYTLLIVIPAIIFLIEYAVNQRKSDIIKGCYALTLVYMMNAIFTVTLKILVGRPRPNFFMRCFPDGYGTDINNCTGEYKVHMDGRKSFPSAHSTFAFSGMYFMTLRMARLLKIKDRGRMKGWKCLLVTLPVIFATLIGVSRTCDYHHHYTDIIFGAIIGIAISYGVYYAYYWSEGMSNEQYKKSMMNFYVEKDSFENNV